MDYSYLLIVFENPLLLLLLALGTLLGIYVGAIPGLSGTMAVSLLVSLTFGWDTYASISLMTGVFVGAVFGGSRSAILLNIPGAPAAVATGLDGYPLAQKGLAGKAMALATVESVLGTVFGALVMLFLTPAVSKLALSFKSIDYLMLAFMGLLTVGSLGCRSLSKGIFAAAFGVFLGTIGIDSISSVKRFTFGIAYLNSGVNFVVALIGLFGVSEALLQLNDLNAKGIEQQVKRVLPSGREILTHLPLSLRSAIIGVLVGALPGAGGDIAALLSYDAARRTVKHNKCPFGEGAVEGVIAPETANNAAIGGAFIPMLTLGIPGDSVTAVFISVLQLNGMNPGPGFLGAAEDVFMLIVAGLLVSAIFMLIFGMTGIRLFARLTRVPRAVMVPLILLLSTIGAYAINSSVYDIFWMFLFGIIGMLLKRHEYPVGPVVLGIILSSLLENNLRRGILLNGSLGGLCLGIFKSPLSIALFVITLTLAATQSRSFRSKRKKQPPTD